MNIKEVKRNLSRLIERVLAGEEIVIARGGRPAARLVPLGERSARRTPGSARGQIFIREDFGSPLPELEEFLE